MDDFDKPPHKDSWCGGKRIKFGLILFGLLVICNILVWQEVFSLVQNQYLEVIFFDVGQGDAIFIETPQKHQILIDGGPDSTILEKISKELPFWDRSIDLIILTHPEKDHLAGLIEVLKRYKIKNILWTGIIRDTSEYKKWKDLINNEKAKIIIADGGERIIAEKVLFDILYPIENLENKELDNSNDTSIVSRLIFGQNSFLFTGDISGKIEQKLIEEKINLVANILKVSHHGSKYSSTDEFLEAVNHEIAVIQVGKNSYGHPTSEVLERLKNFEAEILRTDKNGDIRIFSDGENLKLRGTN